MCEVSADRLLLPVLLAPLEDVLLEVLLLLLLFEVLAAAPFRLALCMRPSAWPPAELPALPVPLPPLPAFFLLFVESFRLRV